MPEYDDDLDFMLEPDDHRYLLSGVEIPACTRVLTDLARKPMTGIPQRNLEYARERGKSCHRAVELHHKNDLDHRKLTREIKVRLDSWLWFIDEYRVEPIPVPLGKVPHALRRSFSGGPLVEVPLVHPTFQYGVTPDCALFLVMGVPAVVEVKAVSSHNDATAIQTAAQEKAVNCFFEPVAKVEARWGVRLTPGKPEVLLYKDRADWSTWLSFLNVYNWRAVHRVA